MYVKHNINKGRLKLYTGMCYNPTMTTKQKTALDILVGNGGNVTQAMLQAGYSPNTANTPSKLTKAPAVQNELQRLLKKKGITLDKALQPIADGLTAIKMVVHGKNSEESWVDEIPDHGIRMQASDRALKLMNITKDKENPHSLEDLTKAIEDNVDEVELQRLVFKKSD